MDRQTDGRMDGQTGRTDGRTGDCFSVDSGKISVHWGGSGALKWKDRLVFPEGGWGAARKWKDHVFLFVLLSSDSGKVPRGLSEKSHKSLNSAQGLASNIKKSIFG